MRIKQSIPRKENFLSRGFTLVELLIVMAVIGVLAAIVLVAINPLEQLSRGRDSARIQGVGQLGRAMVNYVTAQGTGTYPAASTTWQATLTTAKELANKITSPTNPTSCKAADVDSGFCYEPLNTNADFVVWVLAESQSEKSKATNCTGSTAIAFYSNLGRVRLVCLANATDVPTFNPSSTYDP